MSGHVYYRFKSQKDFQRVLFDGIGISVWDLKREIITDSKMGKGTDFDFAIYNADTEEEYKNDHAIIPRSSSVIARRLPPKRSGHGNAQQYVNSVPMVTAPRPAHAHHSGPGPAPVPAPNAATTAHADWRGGGAISKDFRHQQQQQQQPTLPEDPSMPIVAGNARDDEAASMAAMFAAQDQQWMQTQATMATATRVGRVFGFRNSNAPVRGPPGDRNKAREVVPDMPHSIPPQGYICYRCGQKGHWIQNCPTNDDPEFEGRPRIKRTTGIPKSFLQRVESAIVHGESVMVTADGSFVVARPDDASWKQHKSVVVKNLSAADIQSVRPTDPDLACSICSTLLKEAVKTSCCQSAFCHECISAHLKEHTSVCPECETKLSSHLSKALIVDEERRTRSREYVDDLLRASRASKEEANEAKAEPVVPPVEDKSVVVDTSEATKTSDNLTVLYSTNGSSSTDQPEATSDKTGDSQNNTMPSDTQPTQGSSPNSGGDSGKSTAPTSATSVSSNVAQTQQPCQFDESANGAAHQFGGPAPMQNHMLQQMNGGPMGNVVMSANNGMMGMMNGGNGMPGGHNGNHNAGMNSNHHMGMFMPNGQQNGGQGMNMGMMNGEEMLPIPIQMNKIMMMLQNPQLQQPVRMQLMMQLNHLQQMFMMQNMGSGTSPMNNQMSQRPAHMMQMNMMNNGMMPSHMGQNSMMNHQDHQRQQQPGTGPHRGPGGSNRFQSRGGRGGGSNHQMHDSSPYQRLPLNGRRSNSNKRGRCEDLIELQSGEKVPRYM